MCQDEIVIWGNGDYLKNIIDKIEPNLNIVSVIDMDPCKQGEELIYGDKILVCCEWNEEKFKHIKKILVATRSVENVSAIKEYVKNIDTEVIHINTEVEKYKTEWEKLQINNFENNRKNMIVDESEKIRCFVSVTVPISYCNLQCQYCYVGQHQDFYKKEVIMYSTEFIKRAFSKERFGGRVLINLCGTGETLLCNRIVDIVKVFLEEGHYVSIITNALVEETINKLLQGENIQRLFFKCSLHYEELKKKKLLDKYSQNVNKIIASKASCSIELVPHDELISIRDEIKEYCIKEFGALPHVTVARDENCAGYPILSSYDYDTYKEIWSEFNSPLFDVKMRHQTPETGYCIAGKGTILVDLEHGGCKYCPNNKILWNFYQNIAKPLNYEEIGYNCKSKYCINSHAYLTLGMIPDVKEISYLEVRDRVCKDKSTWVKEPVRTIYMQRICDNLE